MLPRKRLFLECVACLKMSSTLVQLNFTDSSSKKTSAWPGRKPNVMRIGAKTRNLRISLKSR